MNEVMRAIDQSRKAIKEMEVRADQMFGSMESVIELISEDLPKDKIDEWCEKYNLPVPPPNMKIPKAEPELDIAGSTASQRPPPQPQPK
jgi:hypothetical protein